MLVRIVKESITGAERIKRKLSVKLSSINIVNGVRRTLFIRRLKNSKNRLKAVFLLTFLCYISFVGPIVQW